MDAVNFQSLNMVRDELVATIEEAARNLEMFVTAQQDGESLQACMDGIRQIVGILRLIQFRGACILAEELLATATDITPGDEGPKSDQRLEVVSNTFFVLTRYLEYVQQVERRVPVLLIPHINALRKMRGEPAFSESHFFHINLSSSLHVPPVEQLQIAEADFRQHVRRLRHMYQVGLLALIRGKQAKNSLAMMRRACIRLHKLGGSLKPLSQLWWLSNLTLDVLATENMAILEARKLLFSRIDRVIRQVEKSGSASFAAQPPKGLIKELVYLLVLSGKQSEEITLIRKAFGINAFPYSDKDLSQERDALSGPSAHTVTSLAKVLQAELSNTKKVLENAAQSSTQKIDDLDEFIGTLKKVAEILSVVGLVTASSTLKEEIERLNGWHGLEDGPDIEELSEVANTLLYLESTVAALEHSKLSTEKLNEASKIAQREIIASGELSIARKIVIEECEAGILLTKRALSSFSDSDYDTGHIRNIAKTLTTVKGGLLMLGKERVAAILGLCVQFVEEVLLDEEHPAALKELLETFADAIISVEYYLDSSSGSGQMDETVLQIAEESLEALGFSIHGDGE
ncbi:CDP-diacylglycerol--glycerol-3-phosphate 3-phosphatidyltransferase [Saccharophagus degradans]|uniref:CDP-diacylglycerol--glycerol-3-phosphate 3-phosphatidyltransferase n=1 Tax=Saccharophagus degradans TaxID=86304 RepID=A0AAW7X137_9GAMM|nr:CDP-diacylglycerol--glycerol-3-phosphate 3-phosphatidyltransferase [Saccharophagus degradans]MDO6421180.1 CDP-diacylglycerol--glycerol-3-phosphate 3-phosphatidyltransferase [Saccharophagus degradans]MDO6605909.1 CDP-diacylglycerol--glycerol-3-phosphate 3-phosphatidyltransferase [Saccharophagus degradans]